MICGAVVEVVRLNYGSIYLLRKAVLNPKSERIHHSIVDHNYCSLFLAFSLCVVLSLSPFLSIDLVSPSIYLSISKEVKREIQRERERYERRRVRGK